MAGNLLVDAGFLVALLSRRDSHHAWAAALAAQHAPPWRTCEAVVSEAFHLLGKRGAPSLSALLRRRAVLVNFAFADEIESVLRLVQKYADVPMSFADACLVRMTETFSDPFLLTTDSDFRVYRRHSRLVIPCAMPS
jgi:predicted nucleic acid-binding protein